MALFVYSLCWFQVTNRARQRHVTHSEFILAKKHRDPETVSPPARGHRLPTIDRCSTCMCPLQAKQSRRACCNTSS